MHILECIKYPVHLIKYVATQLNRNYHYSHTQLREEKRQCLQNIAASVLVLAL